MLGIVITFLGVRMGAIPTGIISAGFVAQYTTFKKRVEYGYESEMHFIKVAINENDKWCGLRIADFKLPEGIIIAAVKREEEMIIPRGDIVIEEDDVIILGAEPYDEKETINLKEIVVKNKHPWNNKCIKNLDISRNSVIVLVKRKNKALIPNGNMFICEGDRIYIYTKTILEDMNNIEI
jgi:voltage-gated potassium channel